MAHAKAVCLILAVAACGDPTGPRLADPRGIANELDALSGRFESDVFESGARLSAYFPAAMPAAPAGEVLPAEALGTTYEWSLAASRYEPSGAHGAPPDAVRFRLYALDAAVGTPTDPLVWIGNVDLTDVTVGEPKLRLAVATGIGVHADYTVSGTGTTHAAQGEISGVAFEGTLAHDQPLNSSIDLLVREESQGLESRLTYTFTFDGFSQSFAMDFHLQLGADVVDVSGSGAFSSCAVGSCGGGTLAVTVNGQAFATVVIDAEGGESYHGNLTPDERLALDAIRRSIYGLRVGFGRLVTPGSRLLGASLAASARG